ncbi:MAG: VWA domain-containing protein [Devosia sp.]|nr:VWA domain-containing protein [Devosia sp.]
MQLAAGTSRVETLVADFGDAPQLFELAISRSGLAPTDNDRNGLWVAPRPAGRVAVIARDAFQGAFFARMLRTQGLEVVSMVPGRAPFTLDGWLGFDGIVLLDVPAISLNTAQHRQIEKAVTEHGRGLLLLGGPNSFGPGGYLETALERLSPLSSNIPRETPKVAMVFVLDRSGSMQQPVGSLTRLDIAKHATDAAIRLLNPESQVAIIVFDEAQQVVLPLQEIGDGQAITRSIAGIDAGGGTSMHPGLVEAAAQLGAADSQVKHVIVMTDGLSQPGDFPAAISSLRALAASVSSVAIGQGAGASLVETLATLGGGTFHATQDFEALPSILSQEALLLSEDAVEIGASRPQWIDHSATYLRNLPETMPEVDGFVLTTAKPEATVLLATPDRTGETMPLMATWRYGNGQVTALATQAIGDWAGEWQTLESYPAAWSQMIRQFLPPTEQDGLRITATRVGDSAEIVVRLDEKTRDSAPAPPGLNVRMPELAEPVSLAIAAAQMPGEYRARFSGALPADYIFEATVDETAATVALHMAYPRILDPSASRSGHTYLVNRTGGGTLTTDMPLPRLASGLWVALKGWPAYLLAAIGLFMVELAFRYSSLAQRTLAPRTRRSESVRSQGPTVPPTAPRALALSQ